MEFHRPTSAVTLSTVVASAVLAAGGFVLGSRSDDSAVPASVPFAPAKPAQAEGTIVVPERVDLPRP